MLPIARPHEHASWQSGRWFLRSGACHLIPGDSPLGYRLPLDSLPWVRPTDQQQIYAADPMQEFAPLPPRAPVREQVRTAAPRHPAAALGAAAAFDAVAAFGTAGAGAPDATGSGSPGARDTALPEADAAATVRTSMCAEERGGVLYVFMPPTRTLEDYLELVAAVEASAGALGQPVVIEGYEPPADPRLVNFKVTPDPGRHRGQRTAERELGRARRAHLTPLRRGERVRSCAPRNS